MNTTTDKDNKYTEITINIMVWIDCNKADVIMPSEEEDNELNTIDK